LSTFTFYEVLRNGNNFSEVNFNPAFNTFTSLQYFSGISGAGEVYIKILLQRPRSV